MNWLVRKGKVDWTEEAEEAFQEMKRLSTSKPPLVDLPVDGADIALDCDASGEVRVIGHASTLFTEAEGKPDRSSCSGLLYPIFCGLPLGPYHPQSDNSCRRVSSKPKLGFQHVQCPCRMGL
eukprot:Blabericola_migrator_1__7117@NODE_3602_length_1646_cov_23_535149_g2238_i0_p1_GENE_NODE_3602_length_1646_cov_23_535149_g2238_i0NODE_3602_length_1646_cov_23_535149_g2238_i0_p1_ORF_typecomplete_len122_score5_24RT_RNaseH_2/PF17919_1/4_7e06PPR/PF01535_20/0_15FTP/PF07504_13/0_18FTP/PF07504_13/5_5e03PPR_2/PF13041_6/0_4PPR_2/PF13041_6/8_8e03_NODE_3602_length_1646_cov_23_535149_g2238_i06801045